MINKYDDVIEVLYEYRGVTERVTLHKFKLLYPNEFTFALENFKNKKSVYLQDWEKKNLELEFFQNLGSTFNAYTDSDIRILGIY